MQKKELRSKYKALRSQLSENDIETMSMAIAISCLHCLFGKTYFHIFYPLQSKRSRYRINLHLLSGKDKEILISKPILKLERWHFLLTDNTKIKKNSITFQNPLTESKFLQIIWGCFLYPYWLTTNKAIVWVMKFLWPLF
jgi:5-formyltetrahydrofolate cyclo-ligase